MTTDLPPELARVGDELERSIARELAPPRRRRVLSRTSVTALVAGGALVLGGGVAAAIYLTPSEVATGMPGAAVIFTGTDPTCTTEDHLVFECTLSSPPISDVLGPVPQKGPDSPETSGGVPDQSYAGAKYAFVDKSKRIAGGCIGQDEAGMKWLCYTGERAVEEEIIGPALLGEYMPQPARG
jgi:hypothetical protein